MSFWVALTATRRWNPARLAALGPLCITAGLYALAQSLGPFVSAGAASWLLFAGEQLALLVSGPLWLLFALEYASLSEWRSLPRRLLILAPALVTALLALTNDNHQLVWSSLEQTAGALRFSEGPWLQLYGVFTNLILIAGCLVIARQRDSLRGARSRPGWLILALAAAPPVALSAYLRLRGALPYSLLDPTPLVCAFSALLLELALRSRRRLAALAGPPVGSLWAPGQPADDALRARPDLLSLMSHEIRVLISGIVSVADLLDRTRLGADQQALLRIMRTSGAALLEVVNNTLDLAKIEANKLQLVNAPFSLHTAIEQTLDMIAVEAMRKQLYLSYLIDEGVPAQLIGDGKRVGQVLLNLVHNSVKFTDRGGVLVSVSSRPLDGDMVELRFAVTDTGIGIPDDQHGYLFKTFSQLPNAAHLQQLGSGLGLAISRQLITMMGGTIAVHSSDSRSTTIVFTIVAAALPTPASSNNGYPALRGRQLLLIGAASPCQTMILALARRWGAQIIATETSDQALTLLRAGQQFDGALIIQGDSHDDNLFFPRRLQMAPDCAPIPAALLTWVHNEEAERLAVKPDYQTILFQPLKQVALRTALLRLVGHDDVLDDVDAATSDDTMAQPRAFLVIDDDTLSRELSRRLLQTLGYQAHTFSGVGEGFAALERQSYDVLLLDIQLEDGDGLALARQIRASLGPAHQPYIVAVTGERVDEQAELYQAAGMNAWLSKPLTMRAIAGALGGYQSWRTHQEALAAQLPDIYAPVLEQAAIDEQSWRDFIRLLNFNSSEIQYYVDQYISDTEHLVNQMRLSLDAGDHQSVARAAHKLKSSSTIVSAKHLAMLCGELDGSTNPSADYNYYVHLIENEYRRVRVALQQQREREIGGSS